MGKVDVSIGKKPFEHMATQAPEAMLSEESRRTFATFPSFYKPCLDEFGFLMTEYDFPAPRLMILGREFHAEFRKGKISFSITHEIPRNVWGEVVLYRDNESLRPIKEIFMDQLHIQLLNYKPDWKTEKNEAKSWLRGFIQYLREDQTLVVKTKVQRLASFVRENYDDILKIVTLP